MQGWKMRDWKIQDWKIWDRNAEMENAGLENVAQDKYVANNISVMLDGWRAVRVIRLKFFGPTFSVAPSQRGSSFVAKQCFGR